MTDTATVAPRVTGGPVDPIGAIERIAGATDDSTLEKIAAAPDNTELQLPAPVPPPIDVRGAALSVLAILAVVYALNWAQVFFISLILGIVFAYTLNPLVEWLERVHVPRVLGAAVVMVAVVGALGLGAYSLRGEMQTILDQLPMAAARISASLASMQRGPGSNMQKVQKAASVLESATAGTSGPAVPAAATGVRPTHVIIDTPTIKLGDALLTGSMGVLGFMGHATMVMFLVFFLLAGGDTFKRKLVRLTGPPLSRKKITVHILEDINSSIQKYMGMMLITNVLVAVLCWIAFRLFGLENAGAWAAAAGVLHLIPYFGPAITAGATGMAAFMQFDSLATALLVAGSSMAIAVLVGTFVTTWMTGRIAKINATAIFISLLFWGWLWGAWGMLLSIPIVVIIKVLSQHIERLNPLSEMLGE